MFEQIENALPAIRRVPVRVERGRDAGATAFGEPVAPHRTQTLKKEQTTEMPVPTLTKQVIRELRRSRGVNGAEKRQDGAVAVRLRQRDAETRLQGTVRPDAGHPDTDGAHFLVGEASERVVADRAE